LPPFAPTTEACTRGGRAAPNGATERYMLACALAASGLHADARHVLEALRAARDCPACRDALLNALSDGECSFVPDEVALHRASIGRCALVSRS
jgi:hypothetical protein